MAVLTVALDLADWVDFLSAVAAPDLTIELRVRLLYEMPGRSFIFFLVFDKDVQ